MKLTLDPMPALRKRAAAQVNQYFNESAQPHRDAAHAVKRAVAAAGAPFPDWFEREARLRGITPDALAGLILSKPDALGTRELQRQQVMAEIDAAEVPAALSAIVDKLLRS